MRRGLNLKISVDFKGGCPLYMTDVIKNYLQLAALSFEGGLLNEAEYHSILAAIHAIEVNRQER